MFGVVDVYGSTQIVSIVNTTNRSKFDTLNLIIMDVVKEKGGGVREEGGWNEGGGREGGGKEGGGKEGGGKEGVRKGEVREEERRE